MIVKLAIFLVLLCSFFAFHVMGLPFWPEDEPYSVIVTPSLEIYPKEAFALGKTIDARVSGPGSEVGLQLQPCNLLPAFTQAASRRHHPCVCHTRV